MNNNNLRYKFLRRFERKILKRTFGSVITSKPANIEHGPITNALNYYDFPDIVQEIKSNRLKWIGPTRKKIPGKHRTQQTPHNGN